MNSDGGRSTYRDIYGASNAEDWVRGTLAERILCGHCGLLRVAKDRPLEFELWYRANVRGHTLWAYNEEHIDSLIAVLAGERPQTGTPHEALPGWMLRDRAKVIDALRKLRDEPPKAP